jgi:hypothetical protein
VFTARYALSPYTKQIRFVFKGLISILPVSGTYFSLYILLGLRFASHLAVMKECFLWLPVVSENKSTMDILLFLLFWLKRQLFIFDCTAIPLLLFHIVSTPFQVFIIRWVTLSVPS